MSAERTPRPTSTRRGFLAGASAWLAGAALVGARRRCARPNFLLLVGDDLGVDDVGCYGHAAATTPRIDAFARDALRFTRAFTPTAICQPSRAALHTGLHGTTSGADGFTPLKPGVQPLSVALKAGGYRTALHGKTHLDPIEQFAFDELVPATELSDGRDPAAFAARARAFLRGCKEAKVASFLAVNFVDPHHPWPLTADEARRLLPRWEAGDRATVDPRHRALGDVAGLHDPAKVRLPALLPDHPSVRRELARYSDAVTRLDRGVGLVLDVLEEEGLADSTVVLFLSDNGIDFPFHKTTLWEGGIRQPLLVRWPGTTPRGATCDGLVSFVDVMPTLLELAGVASPPVEGRSFAAALRDPAAPLRDEVLLTHTRHRQEIALPSRGLRTARFKYLRNPWPAGATFETIGMENASWGACLEAAKGDAALAERVERLLHRPPVELYDLDADPLERSNLAGREEHAKTQAELDARLRAAMAAIKDPLLPELGASPAEGGR